MPDAIETKIQLLFTAIDARTAKMPPEQARDYLNIQIDAWEERERKLLDWCQHKRDVNPYPDLDAFQIARIIIYLFSRLDALRSAKAA